MPSSYIPKKKEKQKVVKVKGPLVVSFDTCHFKESPFVKFLKQLPIVP